MPDNFAHQGESRLRLLSATSIEIELKGLI